MNKMHWIAVGALTGGLVALLGLGWWFGLKPQSAKYDDLLATKKSKEDQLRDTRQKASQFEKFKAEAENVRRDLDFYSRRLDPDFSMSETFTLIDGVGHSFNFPDWGFTIKDRGKTKEKGLNLDEVEINAKFTADYESLGKMINLCLKQVRLVVPDTLDLAQVDDPTGRFNTTLKADVGLKVFVGPEEKKAKGAKK